MRKRSIILISCLGTAAALALGAWAYLKWKFPYGRSHCCIVQMMFALELYAEEHGGRYPAGESSAEASLSLLYRSGLIDAYILRGMTIPEKKTRSVLQAGRLLSPESCGWHYVAGLTRADDGQIALLWCKEALGHNGERTKDGGREVVLVGARREWIHGTNWKAFLEEQKELLEKRSAGARAGVPLVTGLIELPDGTRLDRVDGGGMMREESSSSDGSGYGTSSGSLGFSELVWYRAPLQDGSVTRTLSFSNMISDPVTIRFTNGVPDLTNVVFRMRSER